MTRIQIGIATVVLACAAGFRAQEPAPQQPAKPADASPHTVQFVTVQPDIKLEVLDWGGSGRPLVLLAGLGFDAHTFDSFAPKLVPAYHVYGISRRGFGASSKPKPNCTIYSADRLGDDVLAVMGALKLERPILAGHSIAGEELSSIGTRFPDKVAGLVYLDAAYAYAWFNDSSREGNPDADTADVRRDLDRLFSRISPRERTELAHHLLDVSFPRLERDLQAGLRLNKDASNILPPDFPTLQASLAIRKGIQIYPAVNCPVLAIYAVPHHIPESLEPDAATRQQIVSEDQMRTSIQADAFQKANPQAKVVRIPDAEHFIFRSNEADVLREMNAFIEKLR